MAEIDSTGQDDLIAMVCTFGPHGTPALGYVELIGDPDQRGRVVECGIVTGAFSIVSAGSVEGASKRESDGMRCSIKK
jgi:hypothetical protein